MSNEKMQFQLGRPAEVIAGEINVIKEQTRQMIIHAASEIGKRLIEAKEQVAHGEWGDWLKTNVDYSQATANNFMKIHREFDLNSQAFKNLTYTKAVALFGIDRDERESFVQETKADEISTRDLEKLIKEKKQLEAEKAALEEEIKRAARVKDDNLQQMQLQLENLQEQLVQNEQAQSESKELEQKLAVAESTIEQLQSDLKAKPIDVPATVEVVPEAVQRELDELRAAKGQQESSVDTAKVKFKVKFSDLVSAFNAAIEAMTEVASEDDKKAYKTAMHKLMDTMRATVEEVE